VEVTYEGMSCEVSIRANETILSGLERANVMDQLAIPELPSDCRRGNCLTCVGRHTPTSHESSLQSGEDGLSPEMSRQVSKRGYILTCSSRVVGEGVKLQLGEQYKAWKDVYYNRLYDESTQYVSRSAMARAIRMSDERNPDLWAVKTQTALQLGGRDGDNDDQITTSVETDGMA
jgi:ferredoxin